MESHSNRNNISRIWRLLLSSLQFKHPIYPEQPVAPDFSEFVVINSKIRIRCIHINPDILRKSVLKGQLSVGQVQNKRNSLSEEYWFTKWNKPLKTGNCNCSFRRSQRLSIPSEELIKNTTRRTSLLNKPVLQITNVNTFIQRLIDETLSEALQEYYVLQSRTNSSKANGSINFGFENNEEHGNDIVLRKEKVPLGQSFHHLNNNTSNNFSKPNVDSVSKFNRCLHKSLEQKKPIVLFFHGIGTSSDIWWIVINNLVNKGYEIVAPDMLGHGFSSAPNQRKYYTFDNLLLQALAIFDNYVGLEESRKCILIGHSYGCSFATALYRHRTVHISQLILISGGGPTPLAAPAKDDELAHNTCFQGLVQLFLFCGVNRSLFYSSRGKNFDICDENFSVPKGVLHFIKVGQNWPEGDAAFHRRIFVPTLLVHGLQDKQVTLVQECEMERTIPRSFLELISNAGHMSMLETPEHLSHMILCFLDCWN